MNSRQHNRPVVLVDADNTLWDTNAVYANAQINLLHSVETAVGLKLASENDGLAFVRDFDQALAQMHHADLSYPPRLLIEATALGIGGLGAQQAARAVWRGGTRKRLPDALVAKIEAEFHSNLRAIPALRSGVESGLTDLHALDCAVVLLTEGDRQKAADTAEILRIADKFDRIIQGKKDRVFFVRIKKLAGNPACIFMVGDQLDRDIQPAHEAGIRTVFFPGGFNPRWRAAERDVRPDFRIASFAEMPAIVIASCDMRFEGELNGIP